MHSLRASAVKNGGSCCFLLLFVQYFCLSTSSFCSIFFFVNLFFLFHNYCNFDLYFSNHLLLCLLMCCCHKSGFIKATTVSLLISELLVLKNHLAKVNALYSFKKTITISTNNINYCVVKVGLTIIFQHQSIVSSMLCVPL